MGSLVNLSYIAHYMSIVAVVLVYTLKIRSRHTFYRDVRVTLMPYQGAIQIRRYVHRHTLCEREISFRQHKSQQNSEQNFPQ